MTNPLRNEEERVKPVEVPENETQQTVLRRWETHQERWLASSGLTSLQDVVTQYIAEHGTPVISDMICIGLGSLSGTDVCENLKGRENSLYQLAMFLSIVDMLQDKSKPVPVFAQDPAFNALDVRLLESLGITVVYHPAAADIVDQETMVWMPGADNALYWGVAMQQPAVFAPIPLDYVADEWHPNLDEFEENHYSMPFSGFVEEKGRKGPSKGRREGVRPLAFYPGPVIYLLVPG